MPSSRARTNTPIAPPANSSRASSVTTTVRLVVMERPSVWRIEWWTEKPMTVSIAVTNRLSIWTLNSVPRIAKIPTTTMTSWSSEIRAVTPIFTSRKRYVIQSTIPIAPKAMRVSAWSTRSLETTAPTVDSDRCSAIVPSSSSSATRISPIFPWVGSWPPPVGGAEREAPGEAAADALGDGDASGDALASGLALATGLALAPGLALVPAEAEADASGDADGTMDGLGVGAGAAGRSRVSLVRISVKPSPLLVTMASTPCASNTSWTCCGVTFSSSNRIDQTVPPVKSMANWSPWRPPVSGPSRMKITPGIVSSSENAKNQRRLPMMSNTRAGLSPDRAARRAREELVLRDAVEARLAGPRLLHDDAHDRPGDGHRGEHRDEDTDDQDEAEAADRRRAEQEQDQGGDEARHVRVEDRVPGAVEAGLDRGGQALADPQLLLHALEDQDVGIDRHADREHEARDAGEGERDRDEPEQGVHHEGVDHERDARDDTRHPVVDDHEEHDH